MPEATAARGPRWRRRPTAFVALAAIQLFLLVSAIVYFVWPPGDGRSVTDVVVIGFFVLLILLTILALPRLVRWTFHAMLAVTWTSVAALTLLRADGQAQFFFAVAIVLLAVFAIIYLPHRSAVLHVVLMVLAYLVALVVKYHSVAPALFMLVTIGLVVGAAVVGGLRANDRRERLLIDYASDVVFHSANASVQWISPSVREVLGWEPDDLIGTNMQRLWHPEDHDKALAIRQAAYDGQAGIGVLRFLTRDGAYVWIEITFKPYGEHGEGGAVGTMRDVSDRVRAEQALMASEHEAREMAQREAEQREIVANLDEVKSRLFQNVSHELRTPITMIQAPLQELLNDSDEVARMSARRRADLQAASRAAGRLQHLVDGLLDVARGQAGALRSAPEPTDLARLTRDTVAMFKAPADNAGVQLNVSTVAFPPSVVIDRDMWVKILTNLVSNAVKFTSNGDVDVSLRYAQDSAELVVADTGVGIAEEDLPAIFTRFQQAQNHALRGDVGSGIGLALVAELVRAAEGSIQVDSIVGVGTTFTVKVPTPRTNQPPAPVAQVGEPAAVGALATSRDDTDGDQVSSVRARHAGRVLIVEDHADLRGYLERLLGGRGWAVTGVATAEAGQGLLAEHDLLVTDLMLPGQMDGLDLMRWARHQPELRRIPIIALTAKSGTDSMIECLEAGADDFVAKPFHPDELLARVSTHLELSLLRKAVLGRAADHMPRAADQRATTNASVLAP